MCRERTAFSSEHGQHPTAHFNNSCMEHFLHIPVVIYKGNIPLSSLLPLLSPPSPPSQFHTGLQQPFLPGRATPWRHGLWSSLFLPPPPAQELPGMSATLCSMPGGQEAGRRSHFGSRSRQVSLPLLQVDSSEIQFSVVPTHRLPASKPTAVLRSSLLADNSHNTCGSGTVILVAVLKHVLL